MNTTVQNVRAPNQPPIAGRAVEAGAPQVEMTYFYSTTGAPVQLALTDGGHTAIVLPLDESKDGKGTPLHPRFHRLAVTRGCLPVGARDWQPPTEEAPPTRQGIIMQRLREMLDGNDEADFTRAGLPDMNQLQRRCGFRVTREEADAAWAIVKKAD